MNEKSNQKKGVQFFVIALVKMERMCPINVFIVISENRSTVLAK